jgi:hypothetical protein
MLQEYRGFSSRGGQAETGPAHQHDPAVTKKRVGMRRRPD